MAIPRELEATQAERSPQVINDHPGWGASIEDFLGVMRQAEAGRPGPMCRFFDDVNRRDGTLRGYVSARRAAIAGKPVLILPGADDSDSKRTADEFRALWDRMDTRALLEDHAQGPNYYGWAATEITWGWNREERRYEPIDLFTPRQETFRVAVQYDPFVPGSAVDSLLVRTGFYEYQVERMIPGKWIVTPRTHVERRVWDGMMVTSAIYSLLKTQGVANWFVYLRKYGVPFLKVVIESFDDANVRAMADEVIRRFGEDGGIRVPKNSGLDVEVVDGASMSRTASSDVQSRFVQACDLENAKLWTGGTLMGDTGSGSSSYALAKTQFDIRYQLLQEDAQRIEYSWRKQLIERWHRYNGLPGRPPRVKLFLTRVDDPQLAVDIAKGLKDVGVTVDADHLLEITGMRGASEPAQESNDDGKNRDAGES